MGLCCAQLGRAELGEGPPRGQRPQNPLPSPASYGQKDTKKWENQHLGQRRGGEGRARITGAEHRSGSKSQKEPFCWTLAVKWGGNPHLDPPSVLSKRQCSFYYSVCDVTLETPPRGQVTMATRGLEEGV